MLAVLQLSGQAFDLPSELWTHPPMRCTQMASWRWVWLSLKGCGQAACDFSCSWLQEVRAVASQVSVALQTIRGHELEEKGFGGVFGVGKAATHPPALAVLSHTPPGATETISWVGKGIVYDTGGLSIKGKVSMTFDLSPLHYCPPSLSHCSRRACLA